MIASLLFFVFFVLPYMIVGVMLYGIKVLYSAYKSYNKAHPLARSAEHIHWVKVTDEDLFKYIFFWPIVILSHVLVEMFFSFMVVYKRILSYIFNTKIKK